MLQGYQAEEEKYDPAAILTITHPKDLEDLHRNIRKPDPKTNETDSERIAKLVRDAQHHASTGIIGINLIKVVPVCLSVCLCKA